MYQKRAATLEDKYHLLMGDLFQKERTIVKESRELFKKEQNIAGIQKNLSSFQVALSSISQLSLTQDTQNTFQAHITAIQEQARYLHTMAEKMIDTPIVISKPLQKNL